MGLVLSRQRTSIKLCKQNYAVETSYVFIREGPWLSTALFCKFHTSFANSLRLLTLVEIFRKSWVSPAVQPFINMKERLIKTSAKNRLKEGFVLQCIRQTILEMMDFSSLWTTLQRKCLRDRHSQSNQRGQAIPAFWTVWTTDRESSC